MLDKLVALGLIKKNFDGNTTSIEIQPVPEITGATEPTLPVELQSDAFNPRCDAIAVAHLLASNYNWLTSSPHRLVAECVDSQYSRIGFLFHSYHPSTR